MEFDSLIYIIIAVVLAIVNAVAQKKKRVSAERPAPSAPPESVDPYYHDEEEGVNVFDAEEHAEANPFEILFGDLPKAEKMSTQPEAIEDTIKPEPIPEPETQLNDFHTKMQEKAQEFIDFKHEKNFFDFEEDSIASTAIGDVLSEEEEEAQAEMDRQNDILQDFTAAKAVVFSEIIKPKYFATGVNS